MKFSLALASLCLSSLVAADFGFSYGSSQKVLDDKGEAVPGSNPLVHCKKEHSDDLLTLEHVNLTPNPPAPGQNLTIEAVGSISQDVGEGAYVLLTVKYGFIKLLTTKADLCEQVSNVDLKCPIKAGKTTITKDVEIPKQIPGGKYTVNADAYTADAKHIVCLEASVEFP
ncbi:hypothetical protein HYFRA_00001158 [Hymenoscyphus fraxineus]|uniref:Phosphatidylglycerol/phosphatidylinositol transfer protein n=1 Tax=Hymenoscyphus fraxineus TaxID=746836 RepID=A0A9N9KSP8_9HELO|nr:hypothetical protein HYFRA_00001158 [Hymenoscyphus fraxineus]